MARRGDAPGGPAASSVETGSLPFSPSIPARLVDPPALWIGPGPCLLTAPPHTVPGDPSAFARSAPRLPRLLRHPSGSEPLPVLMGRTRGPPGLFEVPRGLSLAFPFSPFASVLHASWERHLLVTITRMCQFIPTCLHVRLFLQLFFFLTCLPSA